MGKRVTWSKDECDLAQQPLIVALGDGQSGTRLKPKQGSHFESARIEVAASIGQICEALCRLAADHHLHQVACMLATTKQQCSKLNQSS